MSYLMRNWLFVLSHIPRATDGFVRGVLTIMVSIILMVNLFHNLGRKESKCLIISRNEKRVLEYDCAKWASISLNTTDQQDIGVLDARAVRLL